MADDDAELKRFEACYKRARLFVRETMREYRAKKTHGVRFSQGDYDAINRMFAGLAALSFYDKEINTQLVARVAELESRPQLRYVGTWQPGRGYKAGETVTSDGSLWHCDAPTDTRPGGNDAWTLCAKRGRDGRDGRR